MSRLAPTVDNTRQRNLVFKALKLVRAHDPAVGFPTLGDEDRHGQLLGSFVSIEAKNILIAAMVTQGVWDAFLAENPDQVPNPAEVQATYDITGWEYWPQPSKTDGLIGSAADQQANVLANLAFMQLLFEKQPGVFGHRAKKDKDATVGRGEKLAEGDDDDMTMDDTNATVEPPEDTSISEIGSSRATSLAPSEFGRTDPSFVTGTDYEVDPNKEASLPHPNKVTANYRLTRDWDYWPSAGERGNDVSNAQQAQYGIMSDHVFEMMKVKGMTSLSRKNLAQAGKKTKKKAKEYTPEAKAVIEHEVTMNILVSLLAEYILNDGVIVWRANSPKALPEAQKFIEFCEALAEPITFDGPQGVPTTAPELLGAVDDDSLAQIYIEMGVAKRAADLPGLRKQNSGGLVVPEDEAGEGGDGGAPDVAARKRGRGKKTSSSRSSAALERKRTRDGDSDEEDEPGQGEGEVYHPRRTKSRRTG